MVSEQFFLLFHHDRNWCFSSNPRTDCNFEQSYKSPWSDSTRNSEPAAINQRLYMQKMAEAEDKRHSSSGLRGHAASTELTLVNPSKPLKLEFPKFQGEDPSCWIYRVNEFYLSTIHQSIKRYLWHLITWMGRH